MASKLRHSNLVELLQAQSANIPHIPLYTFLLDGETQEIVLTNAQLEHEARKIGARLQQHNLVGERALLLYPPGLDYIKAFFGCLYAGVTAVPVYPPDPTRLQRTLPRLRGIVSDAQPRVILTSTPILQMAEALFAGEQEWQGKLWVATDALEDSCAETWVEPAIKGETVAFLQYTSGSTSTPKGVMLTHDNLLHNLSWIHQLFGHAADSHGVIWLPPYHDMGLIGGILQPLYGGFPVTLLSPIDFLKRPFRWLQAISRYQATTSGGPNFAYDLCIRKVTPEQRETLDLSSWSLAFNGAEPIRANTMQRFAETFAACGFQPKAFYPCYGLAEATLIVSGGEKQDLPVVRAVSAAALSERRIENVTETEATGSTLVGCGHSLTDQTVFIVDPETQRACGINRIGEIWVSGPSVATGYWQQPEMTEQVFRAKIADKPDAGTFLRTGDLGYLDEQGNLFVVGRIKDTIIIRGRNYYPQDIEHTVETSHPFFRPGCGAAFSVPADDQEKLIIVQEIKSDNGTIDLDDLINSLRQAIVLEHEIQPDEIILLKSGSIPKTSSGKIQRHLCRADYLTGQLEEVKRHSLVSTAVLEPPPSLLETSFIRKALDTIQNASEKQALLTLHLQELIAPALSLPVFQLDPEKSIYAFGLDSLTAVEIVHEIETSLGIVLPITELLKGPSLTQLAALIVPLLGAKAIAAPAAHDDAVAEYSLSHGQKALWFIQQIAPENTAYHIACAARLQSVPHVDVLRQAFQTLIERHPSLRTTFPVIDGDVCQVIQDDAPLAFEVVHDADPADMSKMAQQPFNLETGPLFRVHLLMNSNGSATLLFVVHHIIADFWSLTVLAQEFGAIYAALSSGQTSKLPPLTLNYTDYTRWQDEMLASEAGQHLWHYWREQLRGELPLLDMATDFSRPPVQTYRGATATLPLGHELTQALQTFSQQQEVTLFTLLLSAYQVLLHRYTGQNDILVGSPVSGRHWMSLSHLVGYCVNPIVFRAQLGGNPSFLDFLQQIRQTVLDGFAHQDYPFGLLVEKLQPRRDPAYSPIFQTLFIFQQNPHVTEQDLTAFAIGQPGVTVQLGSLSLESVAFQPATAQFDLTLMAADVQRDGLVLALQYNSDLFTQETIERLLENYRTLLRGLITAPSARLSTLPLVSGYEQNYLRHTWNATAMVYPDQTCYHVLFAEQVKRTPDHIAVDDGEVVLSYRELNEQANQLAHHLQLLGAGPERCVGVFLPRTAAALVTLLAILKSGAAYIPLDPAHPQERLQLILDDANAALLVTQKALVAKLPPTTGFVVCLDDEVAVVASRPRHAPTVQGNADNLAYLIYTSGSTGKPKGVQITHRALVNFLYTMRQKPGLTEQDTLLSVTTLSFDIAGLELFLPLLCGATVLLARQEVVSDGRQLAQLLKQATVMQATPATWRLLLESGWEGQANLKMLCGGEALPRELADQLLDKGASLWNMYGPTETTIWSAVYPVVPASEAVPVGHPIGNTELHILDAHWQLVPIGVPGELYIGGDGLARGYFQRPALTAEKFVPHPLADKPGVRLYRTGDLGRYRPDGTIEFLGRIDHQVKVRGFRIELGEIETALMKHPAVVQVVCVAQTAAAAEKSLVAYLVFDGDTPTTVELRQFLLDKIPDYMIPAIFMPLAALPLTPNGKVDRRALPRPESIRTGAVAAFTAPHSQLQQEIAHIWQAALQVEKIGIHDNFFDLGGHSILMARVQRQLQSVLAKDIPIVDLFKYPTIAALTNYLQPQSRGNGAHKPKGDQARKPRGRKTTPQTDDAIAIIGMSCRVPGATTVETFWQNLADGVESVSFFTDAEVIAAGAPPQLLKDPNYVKAGAVLDDVELFDANFFGFNPREAAYTDPQHRIFLECAWEALESAGYDASRYEDRVGVYASVGLSHYLLNNLHGNQTAQVSASAYQAFIGNDKDFVPTRVSYKLDLRGPSVNVQTACSSSLVAVHLARQSLLQGECDMALAGGVSLNLPQDTGYLFQEGGIPSPDGHCRAFDAQAKGTIRGSGAGAVLLKRLSDAVADGDHIWAVIKGTAINNDGANKVGFTAPSVEGQAAAIQEAFAAAQLEAEDIQYVEAHGTGTELGDPIEVAALTQAFQTDKTGFCALGSVKTNIGHLDTAAGMAGLIKTVLSLQKQQIPPSLNFSEPNPRIDFAHSPFYVNTALRDWPKNGKPRRAGVSSFGLGGTNAHLVLEEALSFEDEPRPSRPHQLLLLSAKTATALDKATENLAAALSTDINLADAAYTLQVGRKPFTHRRMLVCSSAEDGAQALHQLDPTRLYSDIQEDRPRPLVFMFSGQGAQYVQMARELYEVEPLFRDMVDGCCQKLQPLLHFDLRTVLFPDAAATEEAVALLTQTRLTQPALFVIEYALAHLWQSWGLYPQAMIGHSIGEYAAACLAGVFSLDDALRLVVLRGQLMQELPPGAMLAISVPLSEVTSLLNEEISLAAVNGPALCVVSGTVAAIEQLEQRLTTEGMICRRLQTSHAFHSAMMEPVLAPFTDYVAGIALRPPQIPFISNVSGQWITEQEATDPAYWAAHLRQPVRFADGLELLLADKDWVLLEVGPGRTLSTLARQHPAKDRYQVVLPSLRHPQDRQSDVAFLLTTLGQLWLAGVTIDWQGFYAHEKRRRVVLPTYPFERQKYWIDPAPATPQTHLTLERKADIADWFSAPVWRQSWLRPTQAEPQPGLWLIFGDECGLAEQLIQQLEPSQVITVRIGAAFQQVDGHNFILNPQYPEDYVTLIAALETVPTTIVHLWSVTAAAPALEDTFHTGFYSLVALAQALEKQQITTPVQLNVISNQLHKVAGLGGEHPLKALLTGPCRTIPQEYPHITCRHIDVTLADQPLTWLGKQLYLECRQPVTDRTMAYRGRTRWLQAYEPTPISDSQESLTALRQGGVYLITGGLGGIGLIVARYLASRVQARLILCGRSAPTPLQQKQVDAIKALGAELVICQADVTDVDQMQTVLDLAHTRFGQLNGVIHAAGLPGGGMIQLKTPEMAWRVLAPKVEGALVLQTLLADQPLDFFWLFSSINAVVGGFGQVDYCAANAFLDALAQSAWPQLPIQAINWDRWHEVGMAAAVSNSSVDHPLWDNCLTHQADKVVYQAQFAVETHWVLSEHKIAQNPTVPGATYLEMVRAAFAEMTSEPVVEIKEVAFLSPLIVITGQPKEVLCLLEREAENLYAFRFVSRRGGEEWQEHAQGKITSAAAPTPAPINIQTVQSRCQPLDLQSSQYQKRAQQKEAFLEVGPRWQTVQALYSGHKEGLAVIGLDDDLAAEVNQYHMHPALLDVATGAIQLFSEGSYLPLAYERLRLFGPLPAHIYSYIRHSGFNQSDTLTCDILVLDEQGQVLVEIQGFTMKRLSEAMITNLKKATTAAAIPPSLPTSSRAQSDFTTVMKVDEANSISPDEGILVLERLLSSSDMPQVVVTTRDIHAVIDQARQLNKETVMEQLTALQLPQVTHSRPDIKTLYVAPENEIEKIITEVLQRVLGINQVGIHDNFFELGGTSLTGIQFVAELKKALNRDIPTVTVFEAPTVRALAKYLQPEQGQKDVVQRGQDRAEKKRQAMQRITRRK